MSSTTATSSPELQELAEQMNRQFENAIQQVAAGQGGGAGAGAESAYGASRDTGTVLSPEAASEIQERFLPALGAILPSVVSAVPSIIDGIKQGSRDLIPETRDPQQQERDFMSVIGAITPEIVEAIPQVLEAVQSSSRNLPRDEDEATVRLFGSILPPLAEGIIKSAPHIANAFLEGRREMPTRISDPEMTSRFVGPLLGAAVPALLPQVPKLIQALK
ncbi:hypothetical protein [Glycomyces xiaoerkulensis]|uniref:hypothetical protein n=1 Tax=Glycomyces xiaoerkulensis TaxID=2038139 RepID=UPI0012FFDD01|nr:hypothetical protein [Glycomyces xiaoerkulensis]